jgi:hypothetical protein
MVAPPDYLKFSFLEVPGTWNLIIQDEAEERAAQLKES